MQFYIRCKGNKEGFLANMYDLRYFLFEKQGQISFVQKTVDLVNPRDRSTSKILLDEDETWLAEFIKEDRVNPPTIKVYKKSINVGLS